ncbi:MAG: class I SAM-dependent rRNA methyltransferase [Nitrospinales bacterium]
MHKIKISKSLQGKIRNGYPWVFNYQIRNKNISGKPGDLGVIYDSENNFLAAGLYDPLSDISLRILQTKTPCEINEEFFRNRFKEAQKLREGLTSQNTTGYRALNGENDGFPGLVIDLYHDTAAIKIYTAAWIPYLRLIGTLIQEEIGATRAVLLMSGHVERTLPKSMKHKHGEILFGAPLVSSIKFLENGHSFQADIINGQKTGFFLDQRDNRKRIGELAKGRSVLNVFSYSGAFSMYSFAGGCKSVHEIDANGHALEGSIENLKLNYSPEEINALEFEQLKGDAFKQLTQLDSIKKNFGLVILDPPAFARKKQHKKNAIQSYIRLIKAGAKRTEKGGILFAASCSAPINAREFYRAVDYGIKSAGKTYNYIQKTGHAVDHPVTFGEGAYLKAVFCEITN